MTKKFEIIYDAKGKVVGTREVKMVPTITSHGVISMKPEKKKPVPKPPKPQVPQEPKPPKAPGPDRGGKVLAVCIEKKIKDPKVIWDMLVEIYAGSKTENYLKGRLQSILSRLK